MDFLLCNNAVFYFVKRYYDTLFRNRHAVNGYITTLHLIRHMNFNIQDKKNCS